MLIARQFLTSTDDLRDYLSNLAVREGNRRAKKIDDMMEAALRKKFVGRVIVWSAARKRIMLASLLSRLVGLELRDYRDVRNLDKKFEVVYRGRVIASMTGYDYEEITIRTSRFSLIPR